MLHLSDLTPGDQHQLRADLRIALTGGLFAAAAMAAVVITVGSVGAGEARSLLESSTPTVRSFCSTVMVVSASTLALMLTLLGLTTDTEEDIKGSHFERIRQIAFVDAAVFAGATLLLLVLIVPINDATEIPARWYVGIYFASTLIATVLGGAVISVIILLYAAIRDLVKTFGPGEESPLLEDDSSGSERAEAEGAEG
ncbi:hypothetical protein [Rubrivirga marina]|uniref:Uncharacterized protein n=1 Tax=Rubrivirga marina TaxID=1196024 RepID=A0A271IY24_9BACT|nr:hypothetical protein [Rubrivirga marina]PAP75694.1 hypothetical protein BSZ37_04205 [Rubrivirga marina]